MDQDFIRLNTVLVIPEEVSSSVISLSRSLAKNNAVYFILGGENYHPHLTLYSPEYPARNLDKVLNAVETVAAKSNQIRCRVTGIKGGQGYIGLEIEVTPQIRKLHEELVSNLNPLREGHIREKYLADYHMEFSGEQMENIKEYGYPNAMSLYHPHLTVTRLKDEARAEEIIKTLEWPQKDFTVSELGIYEMGEHGTCRKLLSKFKLQA